jgi:hypothetical protein
MKRENTISSSAITTSSASQIKPSVRVKAPMTMPISMIGMWI